MESELKGGVTDSSSKVSCVEKVTVLEGNDMGDGKMGSGIKVEKEENDEVSASCQAPSSEKVSDSKGQDAGLLELDNGKDHSPVNPSADGEIVEISSSSDQTEAEDAFLGCQTPTGSIFDPFAPGPEDWLLAPKKKMVRESRIPLRRQLNFDSSESMESVEANTSEDAAEEDHLLELMCNSFIELIVSSDSDETSVHSPSEGSRTPTSLPILTGVAETCPAAPLRSPASRARRLSPEICRKLEFGPNLS